MKARKVFVVFTVAILGLLIAFPSFAYQKDTLRVGFEEEFATMDYYAISSRILIQVGPLIWDQLADRDTKGKILPALAKSWKVVDPTTWELKLEPGVKFHNGNPCDANAVKYTIEEWALNPKCGRLGNFKWIKQVEVVDPVTIRLITHEPYPIVPERLPGLFIYDPIYCKEVGPKKVAEVPMGSGPYQFVKWDRGSQLVLKKNPNYWKKGLPKIENMVMRVIPEMSTRVSELISGGIDFALRFTPDTHPVLEKDKNVMPLQTPILRIDFWQFDGSGVASKTPLMDKRVRQAIIHAVDRKAIIKNVSRGFADELNAPMHPLQFGYKPDLKYYEYNPEKAKALLKEAGYEKGFEIDLWQYQSDQSQPNQAAMGYLEKVGIKVNLKDYVGNSGQLIKLRDTRKCTGIGNYTWGSSNVFDADAVLPLWFTIKEGKCYNHDQELNDWLLEARFSLDPEKRLQLYHKAQVKIMEEAYWMPFFLVHQIYGKHKNLEIQTGVDDVPRFSEAYWK